jgi:hypothetical protein
MLVALLVFIALALVGRVSRPREDQGAWLLWRENQEDRRDDG